MSKSILPENQIETITETYLPKVSVKSQIIYTIVILSVAAVALSLPFIFVDVSVQANGIIRPMAEKSEIRSLVNGTVEEVFTKENDEVVEGQLLYRISSRELQSDLNLNDFRMEELRRKINDLSFLANIDQAILYQTSNLGTSLYAQQLNMLRSMAQENKFAQDKVRRELVSDERLFKEKVISGRELNEKRYELARLEAEYRTLFQKQKSQWQAELTENQQTLKLYQSQNEKNEQQLEFHEIKAPVSGTVQQVKGKYVGSTIHAGEELLMISPNDSLLAECYINPRDIGLLKEKMPVNFQIDAFNYNEWGLVPGEISEISKDFALMNEAPVFKVKCKLNKSTLTLKTGFTAELKKGMTLRGRFIVARRSLFQLLYDTVDDWLNPKTLNNQSFSK